MCPGNLNMPPQKVNKKSACNTTHSLLRSAAPCAFSPVAAAAAAERSCSQPASRGSTPLSEATLAAASHYSSRRLGRSLSGLLCHAPRQHGPTRTLRVEMRLILKGLQWGSMCCVKPLPPPLVSKRAFYNY
jgi:hypothetical protein